MLVQFAIEPEAHTAVEDRGPAEKKGYINRLLDFWRDHGVLVVPKARAGWEDWVSKLDQKQRDSLMGAYKSAQKYRRRHCDICWNELQSPADVSRYADQLDIGMIILEPTRAMELGLSSSMDDPCAHCGRAEITLWQFASDTCELVRLRELSQEDIKQKDTPQAIWENRLRGYAQHSQRAVIVDRWAVRDLSLTHEPSVALPFLLSRLIDGDRKNRKLLSVSVISTYDDGSNPDLDNSLEKVKSKIEDMLSGKLSNSSVKKIDFYLLADSTASQLDFHDRWIRFDDNVIEIGRGLEILEPMHYRRRVRRREGVGSSMYLRRSGADTRKDHERKLQGSCKGRNEHFTISK